MISGKINNTVFEHTEHSQLFTNTVNMTETIAPWKEARQNHAGPNLSVVANRSDYIVAQWLNNKKTSPCRRTLTHIDMQINVADFDA